MPSSNRPRGTTESGADHFRGKGRSARRVDVRFRTLLPKEESTYTVAFTRNIGVGGAFIITDTLPAIGASLQLILQLPNNPDPIEVMGEVRWRQDGSIKSKMLEVGVGVKFLGLSIEQLMALNEYFSSLVETVELDD